MVYLAAASLLWAFSFGLIKGQLDGLDPIALAAARLLLATAAFLPFMVRRWPPAGVRLRAAALGGVQFGLMYVLYLASYRWLPAWLVAMHTVFTPLYVVLLADLAAGRLRIRHLLAALVAVAGGAVVTARALPVGSVWPGVLLLQGANLCFAWGQLRFGPLRRSSGVGESTLLGWMYGGAALVTLAATFAVWLGGGGRPGAEWNGTTVLVLFYLGLVPTALGFYLWNKGAARTKAGVLGAANNLKVPLAVVVAWTVFGEEASYLRAALGLGLLLTALWLAGAWRSRDPRESC